MKQNIHRMTAGAVIMIFGVVMTLVRSGLPDQVSSVLISVGLVLIITNFIRHKKGRLIKDEWTEKIGAYALSYSWTITLFSLLTIFWLDYFALVAITVRQLIAVTYVVMLASFYLFRAVFARAGDAAMPKPLKLAMTWLMLIAVIGIVVFAAFGRDFRVEKALDTTCQSDDECSLPFDYAIRSDCPYQARCMNSRCYVVCPTP